MIDDFIARGWIEWDPDERRPAVFVDEETGETIEGDLEYPLSVTIEGYEALEEWKFEDELGPDDEDRP